MISSFKHDLPFIITNAQRTLFCPYWILGPAFVIDSKDKKTALCSSKQLSNLLYNNTWFFSCIISAFDETITG